MTKYRQARNDKKRARQIKKKSQKTKKHNWKNPGTNENRVLYKLKSQDSSIIDWMI